MVDISSLFGQILVLKDYEFNSLFFKNLSGNNFVLPLLKSDFDDLYLNDDDKILVLGYINNNLYLSYFDVNHDFVTDDDIVKMNINTDKNIVILDKVVFQHIGSLKYGDNIKFTNDTLKFYNNENPKFVSIVWSPTVNLNGNNVTISLNILALSKHLEYYKSLLQ